MGLTPQDIESKRFHDSWRGYNHEEVDTFLDEAATSFAAAHQAVQAAEARVRELEARIDTLRLGVEEARSTEGLLKRTLIAAQRASDQAVAEARDQARQIVAGAEERAAEIQADAPRRASRIVAEAEQRSREIDARCAWLRTFDQEHRTRLRQFLEAQLRALDGLAALPDEPGYSQAPGEIGDASTDDTAGLGAPAEPAEALWAEIAGAVEDPGQVPAPDWEEPEPAPEPGAPGFAEFDPLDAVGEPEGGWPPEPEQVDPQPEAGWPPEPEADGWPGHEALAGDPAPAEFEGGGPEAGQFEALPAGSGAEEAGQAEPLPDPEEAFWAEVPPAGGPLGEVPATEGSMAAEAPAAEAPAAEAPAAEAPAALDVGLPPDLAPSEPAGAGIDTEAAPAGLAAPPAKGSRRRSGGRRKSLPASSFSAGATSGATQPAAGAEPDAAGPAGPHGDAGDGAGSREAPGPDGPGDPASGATRSEQPEGQPSVRELFWGGS